MEGWFSVDMPKTTDPEMTVSIKGTNIEWCHLLESQLGVTDTVRPNMHTLIYPRHSIKYLGAIDSDSSSVRY